ncbi:MAG: FAD:protein FMN transferase, partial [Deltaproteobacteria bacterium]
TTWRPEGELAGLNARAGAGFVEVGPELHQALRAMLDLSAQTGGAFDPAVGPIVRALRENRSAPALSDTTYRIASALRLTRGRAALARGAELDAGAIGKGIAVDAIVRHLRRAGVASAYVDFGASSIAALGVRPDGSPWRVALVGPQGVVGTTVLADEALSTSRSAEPNDPAGAIVDPETLRPVPPGRVATVVAPSATVAEAWSTALVVRGRPALQSAAAHGLEALFADSSGIAVTEGEWFEPVGLPAPASLHPHVELPNREPWERRAERDLARIHP